LDQFKRAIPAELEMLDVMGIISIATILIAVLVLVALLVVGFSNFKRKK
jgi:hypothetical protein